MLVEAGTPLAFIADALALGHTDTRMVEKHDAHRTSYIHCAIRANLPQFSVKPSAKVETLPTK